jgi:ABC-type uncharacterized transport system permease subunit
VCTAVDLRAVAAGIPTCVAACAGSESTPFNEKIFTFMDVSGRGVQDMAGFAFSTWNILSLDRRGLASFV